MTSCSMSVGGPEALFRVSFQSSKAITAKPDILKCFVNRESTPPDKKRSFQRDARWNLALSPGGALSAFQTLYTKQFSAGQAVSLSKGVLDSLKLLPGSTCQPTLMSV